MTGTDPQAYCPSGPWRCGFTAGRLGTGRFNQFNLYDLGSGYSQTPGEDTPVVAIFNGHGWMTAEGWTFPGTATATLLPEGLTSRDLCNGGIIPNDPPCNWHWTIDRWTYDPVTAAAVTPIQGIERLTIRAAAMQWDGTEYILKSAFDLAAYNLTIPGGGEWDDGGVTWGTNGGWTWGERLQSLWALMPEFGRSQLTKLQTSADKTWWAWDGENIATAEPYGWDSGQWPWWPVYRKNRPEDMDDEPSSNVRPEYPVWITCTHARVPLIPTEEYSAGFESGEDETRTILARASVWWFADGVPQHYRPMLLSGSWWNSSTFEDWSDEGAFYFMGCCNWFPYQRQAAYPKANALGHGDDQWTPGDWVTGFPENEGFPDRFGVYEYDWGLGSASDRDGTTADLSFPNLKIDGAMRVPGFEFRVPEKLRELIDEHGAENLVVVSATASVVVTNPKRREYRYESARPAVNYRLRGLADPWPWSTDDDWATILAGNVLTTGEWYGVRFDQLSDDGTGIETWKRQFHLTHTATDARYAPIDSDNTHVYQEEWQDAVTASGAGTPNLGAAPRFIPKRHPWYPTDSSDGPEDIENDPASVKLGHALVGLQYWGAETGDGVADHRVRQPLNLMKRLPAMIDGDQYDATPEGLKPESTGSWDNPPFFPSTLVEGGEQAHRDTDFLNYWYSELGLANDPIMLENIRFRYLGLSHVDPQTEYEDEDNRLYHSTPRTVSMVEVAQALLDSEALSGAVKTDANGNSYVYRHHSYRVVPCLPHDPATSPSEVDGVNTNLSGLFATNLPRVADFVAEGNVRSGRQVERLEEIVFQRFSDWQMTDFEIVVEDPDEVEHTIQIVTPWD